MYKTIKKLFKALNSSGKSWQISGAIVLAMFSGFLPSSTLILLFILFISLVLNINFSLFLVFTLIFSGVGYLFDPLFESIGYSILTSEGLNSIFTDMYNSTIWKWSAFNYTLVTGALVVSLILVVPMMMILNKLITLYRVQIGQKLNEWKFTKWMGVFNEEAQNTSIFRWWGIGVFKVSVILIAIIFVFLFDPLVKSTMEKELSRALETQVNIKSFSSDFFNLHVEISGIEIADKDKLTHNLVQLNKIDFDLGFSALIQKKAFIETLHVDALSFDEKRASAAKAYSESSSSKTTKEQSDKQEKSSDMSNPFTMPNVDDILAKEKLQSIEEAKAFKADVEETKVEQNICRA
ncbi:TIGR03546 family protein [Candidatus Sulfurimonas baltica]|uniref:TIGR03546 family protein n=1 Tax=Candidatus Sulfurimonas baltica TaxID=2740404 RepID=UPI001E4A101B|nr:TIGR03546 family protein [Candidatus Sulfurimonas baltica]